MKTSEELKAGMNKTGAMMSPIDSMKSVEGAIELTEVSEGYSTALGENRIRYMLESEPQGTVPMPASAKGVLSSLQEKFTLGNHAFLDKLGERIAFERTGTRLYEALLSKYHGTEDKNALPPLQTLERFYEEELMHFLLVSDVMTEIGGDPTAITPSANICGTAALGWVQVISDPRTTFAQSLDIILQAELVDNDCWQLLIDLAEEAGLDEYAKQFRKALKEEDEHLMMVRNWVQQLHLTGESVVDIKTH